MFEPAHLLQPAFWEHFADPIWLTMAGQSMAYAFVGSGIMFFVTAILLRLGGRGWLGTIFMPFLLGPLTALALFGFAGLFVSTAAPPRPATLPLRIAHLNALYHNRYIQPKLGFAVTADADIISFVEANPALQQGVAALKGFYPYQASTTKQDDRFAMLILSRWPVKLVQSIAPRAKLYRVEHPTSPFYLLQLHPQSPHLPEAQKVRDDLLHTLIATKLPRPLIVVGDINTVPWDAALQPLLNKASNPLTVAGPWLPTFPANAPMVPIDHVMTSPEIATPTLTRVQVDSTDHLGLIADFPMLTTPSSLTSPSIFVQENLNNPEANTPPEHPEVPAIQPTPDNASEDSPETEDEPLIKAIEISPSNPASPFIVPTLSPSTVATPTPASTQAPAKVSETTPTKGSKKATDKPSRDKTKDKSKKSSKTSKEQQKEPKQQSKQDNAAAAKMNAVKTPAVSSESITPSPSTPAAMPSAPIPEAGPVPTQAAPIQLEQPGLQTPSLSVSDSAM